MSSSRQLETMGGPEGVGVGWVAEALDRYLTNNNIIIIKATLSSAIKIWDRRIHIARPYGWDGD